MLDIPEFELTLNGDAVLAPARRAAMFASEAVGTCIRALNNDDCASPEGWGEGIKIQLKGLDFPPHGRREVFVRWLLAKGFHDLARGLRYTLEEALFFIKMMEGPARRLIKADDLQQQIDELRSIAAQLPFRELLRRVNEGLRERLSWEQEFQSFQNVRNCLEHRDGRVSERDLDTATKSLILTFPRFKIFYLSHGLEVELVPPCELDPAENGMEKSADGSIPIRGRLASTVREYQLGEAVEITVADFHSIAMGCNLMADDLGAKLPSVPSVG